MRRDSDDIREAPGAGTAAHLAPLKDLQDFKVADGDPDVRGWHVYASDGHRIGEVDDLLVDTSAMKVRYLVVDLDLDLFAGPHGQRAGEAPMGYPAGTSGLEPGIDNPAMTGTFTAAAVAGGIAGMAGTPPMAPLATGTYGTGAPIAEGGTGVSTPHGTVGEHFVRESLSDEENLLTGEPPAGEVTAPGGGRRRVLIPIGRARLDRDGDRVFVDTLRAQSALELPEYGHGPMDRDFEASLLQKFDRGYVHSPERDRDFYRHSLYDEGSFYRSRRERDRSEREEQITGEEEDRLLGKERGSTTGDANEDMGVSEQTDAALPSRGKY